MLELLGVTLLTGAVDSLNPIAIMQQFVLQGMVKKPRHIWCFILSTGLTNMASGFLAYYGVVALLDRFFAAWLARLGGAVYGLELAGGVMLLVWSGYRLYPLVAGQTQQPPQDGARCEEAELAQKIKSVSPPALVLIGVAATVSELATALPYFAFLAVLVQHRLSLPVLTLVLVLYNLIYISPQMLLYAIYRKARSHFDAFYAKAKRLFTHCSHILWPCLCALVGGGVLIHALLRLLA